MLFYFPRISQKSSMMLWEFAPVLGEKLGLIPENEYALVWVVDFPADGI